MSALQEWSIPEWDSPAAPREKDRRSSRLDSLIGRLDYHQGEEKILPPGDTASPREAFVNWVLFRSGVSQSGTLQQLQ